MKINFTNFLRITTPIIIGSLIGIIISKNIDYNLINNPPLSPPSFVFPIIWSILYLLIGYSYYSYRKNNNNKSTIFVYYLQLILNFIWPILFFYFKFRFTSILELIILIIFSITMIILYKKSNELSFYLTIPYIIWLLFALYLNIGVYILN